MGSALCNPILVDCLLDPSQRRKATRESQRPIDFLRCLWHASPTSCYFHRRVNLGERDDAIVQGEVRKDPVPTLGAPRHPLAGFQDSDQGRRRYVLRKQVLRNVSSALAESGTRALLVKGSALALTIYPRPWERQMADIDLVVERSQRARVVAALARSGCRVVPIRGHRFTAEAMGEQQLWMSVGPQKHQLEVHHSFDKIVPRPIDHAELFSRACPAPDLPGLLVPSTEDQVLLVALHASFSEFQHPAAWLDLKLLLQQPLDWSVLERRARAWSMKTALFVALETLRGLEPDAVNPDWVRALRPSALRRRLLSAHYDIGAYPVARWPRHRRFGWALSQTGLRDDYPQWFVGLARCSLGLCLDRFFPNHETT